MKHPLAESWYRAVGVYTVDPGSGPAGPLPPCANEFEAQDQHLGAVFRHGKRVDS